MSPNFFSTPITTAQNAAAVPTNNINNKKTSKTSPQVTMQEKKFNRSNSLVNTALKWIPILNHHYNNNSTDSGGGTTGGTLKQFGSTVAVQKLRESKWFTSEEQRIFCAVIECGFIVEIRGEQQSNSQNLTPNGTDDDDDNENDVLNKLDNELKLQKIKLPINGTSKSLEKYENEQEMFSSNSSSNNSWFGVVLCKTLKDNKPKPDTIEIFSVKIRQNGVRVYKTTLETIWKNNWQIRINNFADREKAPHNEKDIKNQISFARKARYSLWHNSKHFAYWCRYGSRQQDVRKRQMSECVKWGSVGMNAGMLLIMNNRQRSYTTSK